MFWRCSVFAYTIREQTLGTNRKDDDDDDDEFANLNSMRDASVPREVFLNKQVRYPITARLGIGARADRLCEESRAGRGADEVDGHQARVEAGLEMDVAEADAAEEVHYLWGDASRFFRISEFV